ncbi:hypothetical protein LZ32DRAFT_404214 [Colletotrichum eremochloae]|nr:hypothetical protein LZ32DRAFT_404214 [Colletotrichum eremochloae]
MFYICTSLSSVSVRARLRIQREAQLSSLNTVTFAEEVGRRVPSRKEQQRQSPTQSIPTNTNVDKIDILQDTLAEGVLCISSILSQPSFFLFFFFFFLCHLVGRTWMNEDQRPLRRDETDARIVLAGSGSD